MAAEKTKVNMKWTLSAAALGVLAGMGLEAKLGLVQRILEGIFGG